ncbi:glycosyltransferase family 8 protein [Megasphaera sp. WILCCON 0056]|uniref:glycosyltransferase family 8 protein n=1 Tax=Megasphaera sp. WILCCON 0056 TaxID=3345340 RepID=UPI003A7FD2C1
MEKITLVLAADNKYAQHLAVACASILKNASHPEKICFYILEDAILTENKNRIMQTVRNLKGEIRFISVDSKGIHGFTSGHISKAAYLRLTIDQVLPGTVTKVIYFDTDLVVLDDVEKLWNLSLEGKPLGAVCDFGIMKSKRMRRQKFETLGLPEGDPYFNSGVLIMDLQQWRQKRYGSLVIGTVTRHAFRHHDQDGLNKVFMNNWKNIPLRWNVIPPVFTMPLKVLCHTSLRVKALEAMKNPAVFHWAGRYKPWEFPLEGPFNHLYYSYLKWTTFRDHPMPQPSADMKGKSIKRQNLRMKWAGFWRKILG